MKSSYLPYSVSRPMSFQPSRVPHFQQPTVEEVRSIIREIEAMRHARCEIEQLKEQIRLLMRGYQISAPVYFRGLSVFRARIVSSKPRAVTELGAPPPQCVTTQQRCNRAGQPMFYCGSGINIPLHEIRVQPGQEVVISEWKTTDDLVVNHVGYVSEIFATLGATRALPNFDAARENKREQTDPGIGQAARTYRPDPAVLQEVASYLGRMFVEIIREGDEHLYSHSIAVTEVLLSGDDHVSVGKTQGFGGLQYPTIQMNANGDNFALRLAFAERYLTFVIAHHIHVSALNAARTYMSWRGVDTAKDVTPDGILVWGGQCEFALHPDLAPARGTWEYLFPKK